MRLHSRTGATAIDDPEYGHLEPGDNGGFDLPDDLAERLHRVHVRGQAVWESDIERNRRLAGEELERRQSPEALHDAVARLVALAESTGSASAKADPAGAGPEASSEPETKTGAEAKPARRARRTPEADGK
jgi:hypothetical protein